MVVMVVVVVVVVKKWGTLGAFQGQSFWKGPRRVSFCLSKGGNGMEWNGGGAD